MTGFSSDKTLIQLAAYAPAGVAAVDIALDGFPNFDLFMLRISGLRPATDNVHPYISFSTDGGATFACSVAWMSIWGAGHDVAPHGYWNEFDNKAPLNGGVYGQGNATDESLDAVIWLHSPLSTTKKSRAICDAAYSEINGYLRKAMVSAQSPGGTIEDWTDARLFYSGGNIAAGNIQLFGVRTRL